MRHAFLVRVVVDIGDDDPTEWMGDVERWDLPADIETECIDAYALDEVDA